MKHIYHYYSPNDLYNKIIDGLNEIGKDLAQITLEDLHPVDEFHIRGMVATKELIKLSRFTPDMHILDVGCGVGGSTRRGAGQFHEFSGAAGSIPWGHLLVGNDILTKAYNLHRNLDEERVSLIETVGVKVK